MADTTEIPEPDAAEGAPHPRHAARLFGHAAARAEFMEAHAAGRLHHAWLISGPRGIGKATMAWKLAAFLLARAAGPQAGPPAAPGPVEFDLPDDHPLRRRLAALSEPALMLIRRGPNEKGDAAETQITARVVRRLREFFHLSAADGGRRVVIVDAADEMNLQAANALLKVLEEPPQAVTFLIVSHQPQRLLPTIRSRCRMLRLAPLSPADLSAALAQAGVEVPGDGTQLARLAGGSAGEAVRLVSLDGLGMWRELVALLAGAPGLDRQAAIRLSEGLAGRAAEPRLDLFLTLLDLVLARLARAGVGAAATGGEGGEAVADAEAALFSRLSPAPRAARGWAEAGQLLMSRARRGRAVNLDPGSLILDTLLRIDEAAAGLALR